MLIYCPLQLTPEGGWKNDYTVKCAQCGRSIHLYTHGVTVDSEGTPYESHYCPEHTPDAVGWEDALARAQHAADALGVQIFMVYDVIDHRYTYVTLAELQRPKNWQTNPEGWPNPADVIPHDPILPQRTPMEHPCPCGGAVTCSCCCHDGDRSPIYHEVAMCGGVLVCVVPS